MEQQVCSHLASVGLPFANQKTLQGGKEAIRYPWCPVPSRFLLGPACPQIWPGVRPWSLHDLIPSCILCPNSGLGLHPDCASPPWTALLLACATGDACGEYGQEEPWGTPSISDV